MPTFEKRLLARRFLKQQALKFVRGTLPLINDNGDESVTAAEVSLEKAEAIRAEFKDLLVESVPRSK